MITITIETKGFDKLDAAFRRIADLPEDSNVNPVALALKDYQNLLRDTPRPSISAAGDVLGETWTPLQSRRRKDGTLVPVWGGVKKARGKGNVKARMNSQGRPYKPNDPQLGNRPGGLWDRLLNATPQYLNRGKTVFIRSQFRYSRRQFNRRPWYGEEAQGAMRFYLAARLTEYFKRIMP